MTDTGLLKLLAVSLALFAACQDPGPVDVAGGTSSETTNGLLGMVLAPDGSPAKSVAVDVYGKDYHPVTGRGIRVSSVSDSNGLFEIDSLPAGVFNVFAIDSVSGIGAAVAGIALYGPGDTYDIGLMQLDTVGDLSASLLDADSLALDMVMVFVPGSPFAARTDADGGFMFDGMPDGLYTLAASVSNITVLVQDSAQVTSLHTMQPDTFVVGWAVEDHWLEAERAEVIGQSFEVAFDSLASDSAYVDAVRSGERYVVYSFSVGIPGYYHLWGRVRASHLGYNSFWVRMDDGPYFLWDLPVDTMDQWHWQRLTNRGSYTPDLPGDTVTFLLPRGTHTLEFNTREDNTKLDKLFITNTDSVPSGLGGDAEN